MKHVVNKNSPLVVSCHRDVGIQSVHGSVYVASSSYSDVVP
jgi:hypothetical protein